MKPEERRELEKLAEEAETRALAEGPGGSEAARWEGAAQAYRNVLDRLTDEQSGPTTETFRRLARWVRENRRGDDDRARAMEALADAMEWEGEDGWTDGTMSDGELRALGISAYRELRSPEPPDSTEPEDDVSLSRASQLAKALEYAKHGIASWCCAESMGPDEQADLIVEHVVEMIEHHAPGLLHDTGILTTESETP